MSSDLIKRASLSGLRLKSLRVRYNSKGMEIAVDEVGEEEIPRVHRSPRFKILNKSGTDRIRRGISNSKFPSTENNLTRWKTNNVVKVINSGITSPYHYHKLFRYIVRENFYGIDENGYRWDRSDIDTLSSEWETFDYDYSYIDTETPLNKKGKFDKHLSKHIMFSIGEGDGEVLERVVFESLKTCFPDHKFLIGLHTDTGHPHIHAVLRLRDSKGNWLDFNKDEYGHSPLDTLKEVYKQKLIEHGLKPTIEIPKEVNFNLHKEVQTDVNSEVETVFSKVNIAQKNQAKVIENLKNNIIEGRVLSFGVVPFGFEDSQYLKTESNESDLSKYNARYFPQNTFDEIENKPKGQTYFLRMILPNGQSQVFFGNFLKDLILNNDLDFLDEVKFVKRNEWKVKDESLYVDMLNARYQLNKKDIKQSWEDYRDEQLKLFHNTNPLPIDFKLIDEWKEYQLSVRYHAYKKALAKSFSGRVLEDKLEKKKVSIEASLGKNISGWYKSYFDVGVRVEYHDINENFNHSIFWRDNLRTIQLGNFCDEKSYRQGLYDLFFKNKEFANLYKEVLRVANTNIDKLDKFKINFEPNVKFFIKYGLSISNEEVSKFNRLSTSFSENSIIERLKALSNEFPNEFNERGLNSQSIIDDYLSFCLDRNRLVSVTDFKSSYKQSSNVNNSMNIP